MDNERFLEFLDDHVFCGTICVCRASIRFNSPTEEIEVDDKCHGGCEERDLLCNRREGEYTHKELLDRYITGFGLYMGSTNQMKLYTWRNDTEKYCIMLQIVYRSDLKVYQDTRVIAQIIRNLPTGQYHKYDGSYDLGISYNEETASERFLRFLDNYILDGRMFGTYIKFGTIFNSTYEPIVVHGCGCYIGNKKIDNRIEGSKCKKIKTVLDKHITGFGLYMGNANQIKLYRWNKRDVKEDCIMLNVEYWSDLVIYQDTRVIAQIIRNLPAGQYHKYCTTHDLTFNYRYLNVM